MIRFSLCLFVLPFSPALAASGPFFSLYNTDFIVTISFVIFVSAIVYFKAPQFAAKLIDGQIDQIRDQIERAAQLCREARESLQEAKAEGEATDSQANRIDEQASAASQSQIENARRVIKESSDRRIQAAVEQAATAEKAAQNAIQNQAIDDALAAAAHEMKSTLSTSGSELMMSHAIEEVRAHIR